MMCRSITHGEKVAEGACGISNIPDMHDESEDNHECEEDVERKAN